jgi:hypothetical protein
MRDQMDRRLEILLQRQMKTESIKLSPERRQSLERVAASVDARNTRGTEAGKPSWRALLYAIADGQVTVTRNSQAKAPKG